MAFDLLILWCEYRRPAPGGVSQDWTGKSPAVSRSKSAMEAGGVRWTI